MSFRKGKKAADTPIEELVEIRRKERDYKKRKKTGNVAGRAGRIKEKLSKDLERPLSKQESLQIEMGERQRAFLAFFYQYQGNIAAACLATGIARSTFDKWFRNCPELKEQIIEVNEAMLDLAEQQLLKNIADGKEHSLFFFLCNKGKHRGWQDIRKLAAPKLQGIKINIIHAGEQKALPHVDVKTIEAEVKDATDRRIGH